MKKVAAVKIKIAIVDDHPMVLKGLLSVLRSLDFIEVVGAYINGEAFLKDLLLEQPDVLLLDIHMPGLKGDELAALLQKQYPLIKILAFTNQEQVYYIRSMLGNGVMGYVLKICDESTLIEAIQTVYNGDNYYDPIIRNQVMQFLQTKGEDPAHLRLTQREKEVLELIAENKSSKDIAAELCMGKRTVDNYRQALLLKLDVKNSVALVKRALELGLIK